MTVDKIKIIQKGNGIYSSNVNAIVLKSNKKKLSPSEFFNCLTFSRKKKRQKNINDE